jgi:hypothetical protein
MTNTMMTTMRAQAWYCFTSEHGQEDNISQCVKIISDAS